MTRESGLDHCLSCWVLSGVSNPFRWDPRGVRFHVGSPGFLKHILINSPGLHRTQLDVEVSAEPFAHLWEPRGRDPDAAQASCWNGNCACLWLITRSVHWPCPQYHDVLRIWNGSWNSQPLKRCCRGCFGNGCSALRLPCFWPLPGVRRAAVLEPHVEALFSGITDSGSPGRACWSQAQPPGSCWGARERLPARPWAAVPAPALPESSSHQDAEGKPSFQTPEWQELIFLPLSRGRSAVPGLDVTAPSDCRFDVRAQCPSSIWSLPGTLYIPLIISQLSLHPPPECLPPTRRLGKG